MKLLSGGLKMNELLEKLSEIRSRDHIPIDMILEDFVNSLGIWKEYLYIYLKGEFDKNE